MANPMCASPLQVDKQNGVHPINEEPVEPLFTADMKFPTIAMKVYPVPPLNPARACTGEMKYGGLCHCILLHFQEVMCNSTFV